MLFGSVLFASALLLLSGGAFAQESPNQNQSNTLIVKLINLPLLTLENRTFCSQYIPSTASQWEYMYELVERAFTGEYTPLANQSLYQAQGILNASAYYRDPIGNTAQVNLLKYFDGSLESTNRCGKPAAVRFVHTANGTVYRDGRLRVAALPPMTRVLSHMAQYLGSILGCDSASFPPYGGKASQFQVHRFMDLASVPMHYFIHNLYDSALTMGIGQPDGIIIGTALDNMFNKLCAPPKVIAPYQPAELQNMCTDNSTCADWVLGNATCSAYSAFSGYGVPPAAAVAGDHSGYETACPVETGTAGGCGGGRTRTYGPSPTATSGRGGYGSWRA